MAKRNVKIHEALALRADALAHIGHDGLDSRAAVIEQALREFLPDAERAARQRAQRRANKAEA